MHQNTGFVRTCFFWSYLSRKQPSPVVLLRYTFRGLPPSDETVVWAEAVAQWRYGCKRESSTRINKIIYEHLYQCTEAVCRDVGITRSNNLIYSNHEDFFLPKGRNSIQATIPYFYSPWVFNDADPRSGVVSYHKSSSSRGIGYSRPLKRIKLLAGSEKCKHVSMEQENIHM